MMSGCESIDDWADDRWAKLLESYCRTDYHVASPVCPLTLHVGELDPQQNLSLLQSGVMSWCLVTAWNPLSEIRPVQENDRAQSKLKTEIEQLGLKWWEAAGRDPAGEWPAEESCFVLNISAHDAQALCRKYQQLAVLYGDAEHEPWLLFADWKQVSERVTKVVSNGMVSEGVCEQLRESICANNDQSG